MKYAKIVVALFCFQLNIIFTQWQIVQHNIQNDLNDISFTDAFTGFSVATKVSDSTGVIYRTANGGNNWSVSETVPHPVRKLIYISTTEIFTVGKSYIMYSNDNGSFWNTKYFQNYDLYDIRMQDYITVYASGYKINESRGILVRSQDRGEIWNTTFSFENSNKLFCIRFPASNIGYVCGENGTIRKVVEGVTGWNSMYTGTSVNLNSMYFFNESTGFVVGNNSTLIKTVNGGYPWFFMNTNFTNVDFKSIEFYDANTGFICGTNGFIARTTDGGDNWVQQNSGLNTRLSKILFINRDTAYCAGNSGKFLRTYNGGNPIGLNISTHLIPENYELLQNFPNPFNPVTNILFNIPKASLTRLIIYDELGKTVEVLVNKELAPGSYKYEWNAADYPSGIYFYKLQSGEFVETKKMVLIK